MEVQLVFESKNRDPEEIKKLEIRFPNQKNRLWVIARYWFLFGARLGIVITHDRF